VIVRNVIVKTVQMGTASAQSANALNVNVAINRLEKAGFFQLFLNLKYGDKYNFKKVW
jgi:hypothetical protein